MFLDRMTRRNLELVESLRAGERRGSLLWLLDRTHTAMGARLLRSWVENPMIDRAAIQTRLDAVEALKDDYMTAEEMGQALEMWRTWSGCLARSATTASPRATAWRCCAPSRRWRRSRICWAALRPRPSRRWRTR